MGNMAEVVIQLLRDGEINQEQILNLNEQNKSELDLFNKNKFKKDLVFTFNTKSGHLKLLCLNFFSYMNDKRYLENYISDRKFISHDYEEELDPKIETFISKTKNDEIILISGYSDFIILEKYLNLLTDSVTATLGRNGNIKIEEVASLSTHNIDQIASLDFYDGYDEKNIVYILNEKTGQITLVGFVQNENCLIRTLLYGECYLIVDKSNHTYFRGTKTLPVMKHFLGYILYRKYLFDTYRCARYIDNFRAEVVFEFKNTIIDRVEFDQPNAKIEYIIETESLDSPFNELYIKGHKIYGFQNKYIHQMDAHYTNNVLSIPLIKLEGIPELIKCIDGKYIIFKPININGTYFDQEKKYDDLESIKKKYGV